MPKASGTCEDKGRPTPKPNQADNLTASNLTASTLLIAGALSAIFAAHSAWAQEKARNEEHDLAAVSDGPQSSRVPDPEGVGKNESSTLPASSESMEEPGEKNSRAVDFSHQIVPLLRQRCRQCHLGAKSEGGLSLDTRKQVVESGVVVPGKPEESELLRRVTSDNPAERMPANGPPLTPDEIDLLRRWIAEGMPWQDGFGFSGPNKEEIRPLSLRSVELPPETADRQHPIDQLVGAYLDQNGVEFPSAADPTQWLRRVSYDIIGLPPTAEELAAFAADTSPDRHIRWLKKRLTARKDYAEHWLSFWNDLLRNDYTGTGYIDGGRKQITGWLYRALYDNMPYDEFVRQLAAPTPDSEGFMRGIKWRGNVNASQRTELQFSQNTAQVFLGINMKCASCHDSFIDHWTLKDAYGLAAITADEPLEMFRCDKPTGEIVQARFLYPELGSIDPQASREERLRQYAILLTNPHNGRTARTIVNRIWHRLFGRGLVHPVDEMGRRAWDESLLDYLADYLI